MVAPQLRTSLFVETWMVGRGDLASDCTTDYKVFKLRLFINVLKSKLKFKVRNVRSMRFPQSTDVAFKNSEDHSKWAVGNDDWICIGDINRQQSQARRGGGTVCMQNARVAAMYRSAIAEVECCRGEAKCGP